MEQNDDVLCTEIYADEAFLTAMFYNNPDLFDEYDESKLNNKHFGNKIWGFYFKLGRIITDRGGKNLDDITLANLINELQLHDRYEKYNRFETIQELLNEVKNKKDNFEMYYDNVKKYNLLRQFRDLFGDNVIKQDGKYNYKKLNAEQIANYWLYKVEQVSLNNNDNKYEEEFLLEGLVEEVKQQNENPEVGMPFVNSKLMNRATSGWADAELYILAGFGGKGKTSFTLSKPISSCIVRNEKLVVIANEEGIKRFRRNLLITIMGNFTKEGFARHRINEGKFTEDEYAKLQRAIDWVNKTTNGNSKLITFVFMESYILKDVKKIIKHYHKKGIKKYIIDTGKPSESGNQGKARWEIMTDDMRELYKLCRKEGNGLGVGIWVNVQLADTALNRRYLDESALGESKKMKNEASVLMMMRPVWDDELEEGKHELKVFKWEKNPFDDKYSKVEFTLDRMTDSKYFLLFYPKNRLGQANDTGLPVIVFKVDFNKNKWEEIGQTFVVNDHSY